MLVSATVLNFFFFFHFTAVPQVFSDGFKSEKFPMCAFCIVLMWFVFPFLVFFVLLFAGTFDTEPLLVLGRSCKDPDTGPG